MKIYLDTKTINEARADQAALQIYNAAQTGDKVAQEIIKAASPNALNGTSGQPMARSIESIHANTRAKLAKYIEINGDKNKAIARLQNEITKVIIYKQTNAAFGLDVKSRANRGPKAGPIKYYKHPVKPGEKGEYEEESNSTELQSILD